MAIKSATRSEDSKANRACLHRHAHPALDRVILRRLAPPLAHKLQFILGFFWYNDRRQPTAMYSHPRHLARRSPFLNERKRIIVEVRQTTMGWYMPMASRIVYGHFDCNLVGAVLPGRNVQAVCLSRAHYVLSEVRILWSASFFPSRRFARKYDYIGAETL
ncbi:hypothetical protein PIIN_10119 [Serendipita indica DSM 11827]|uniref:Uncharacterized protein n=1 Tax=Serendipita indica (strain DSM 11827) TaxID=1109443 RepID=G4TXS6_SERID|nr:hypothetical protein PIIN_10119 [Serendipita indica DSM 11827]